MGNFDWLLPFKIAENLHDPYTTFDHQRQGRRKVWKFEGEGGIICPSGWDRVNWSLQFWGGDGPPPAHSDIPERWKIALIFFSIFASRTVVLFALGCLLLYLQVISYYYPLSWQLKFIYSEKATKSCEISTNYFSSNNWWRFCKILWPSQNLWTLTIFK